MSGRKRDKAARRRYMANYWSTRDRAAYYRKRRQIVRALIRAAKDRPCKLCDLRFPAVCMDFHHRNPNTKVHNLASSYWSNRPSKVMLELEKCDVYCANCHRIITHARRR